MQRVALRIASAAVAASPTAAGLVSRRVQGAEGGGGASPPIAALSAAAAAGALGVAAAVSSQNRGPGQGTYCEPYDRSAMNAGWRTERRKREKQHRLIKNLDFIYSCVCEGRLEDYYDVEKELGRGAFGTVYRARNKALGYCRAVKKVVKGRNGGNDQLPLLMREIHALMDLDHPNIVKLVRYFDEGRDIYLVFELCEGPDLFDRINRALGDSPKGMDDAEAASVLRQMLQALKCCHNNYMGHFDVKPENFMYESSDASARLKMIDLGLSSGFKRDREEIRGTAAYMAPEVWDGLYGPEADIWSCGVVLFLMLTGSTLVPEASEEDIERWVHDRSWIRQRLRWARSLGVSDPAMDILSSMLRHNRHQRPTAREALWHPFLARASSAWSGAGGAGAGAVAQPAGSSGGPGASAATAPAAGDASAGEAAAAQEVLGRLLDDFRAFAAEPVLKRASLLLVAHFVAYSCEESRPQRLAFTMLDRSADGELSFEALEKYYFASRGRVPEDLEAVFSGVDVDDDGCIHYVEFLSATLPASVKFSEGLIRRVFDHLDRNRDGHLDARDLAEAFRHGRDPDRVCVEALAQVCNGSATLSWPAFRSLMGLPEAIAAGGAMRSRL